MSVLVVGLGPVPAEIVEPILGAHARFVPEPTDADCREAAGAIVRADVEVDRTRLDQMPELKVIARTGVGVERVDVNEASRRGIPVVVTPGSNTHAVAEGALAHLLALTKSLATHTALVREGQWANRDAVGVGDLDGGVLGILGFGRIGRRVAELAEVFGMEIRAFDPYVDIGAFRRVGSASEAVDGATHVSVHLPATPETHHLINREMIARIGPGTILVNLARGDVLDLDAALWGLEHGHLAGVGLDVFPEEPPVHHALFDHPQVALTPHVMGLSSRSARKTFEMAAQGVVEVLTGKQPAAVAAPTR